MSYILSIYSSMGLKEVLLPAMDNADYELKVSGKVFGFPHDFSVSMEIVEGQWFFVEKNNLYNIFYTDRSYLYDRKPINDQDAFTILLAGDYQLFVIVKKTDHSFLVYDKYQIPVNNQIVIGSNESADLCYQYHNLISGHPCHAVIKVYNGTCVIEDYSANGTFINDIRIEKSRQLVYGDVINIYGLKIIFLGDFLAVNTAIEGLVVKTNVLNEYVQPKAEVVEEKKQSRANKKDNLFHRAPRNILKIEDEPFEIEAPPAAKEVDNTPLIMTIGPSLTMALPMMLGTSMAIISSQRSGAGSGAFMYTGIITALGSALLGVFWAIKNLRFQKKKRRAEELKRFERYSQYLIDRSARIKEKYDNNTESMRKMYCDPVTLCSYNRNSIELWNRNVRHFDFLQHRLGIGEVPFQTEIVVPKESFSMIDDSLGLKPSMIKESYKMLIDVPVCVDLFANRIIGVIGGKDYAGCYDVVGDLVTQIAASDCYTDVKMAFVFDAEKEGDGDKWNYAKWLPHVWREDGKVRYVGTDKAEISDVFYEITQTLRFRAEESGERQEKVGIPRPYYILFVRNPELLEGELIGKYIYHTEINYGITTVLLARSYDELPNECEFIIENTPEYHGIYNVTDTNREKTEIAFDSVDRDLLERFARNLSSIKVKEEENGGEIPNVLTFFDMYGVNKPDELNAIDRWRKNRTYESLRSLVGQKAGGADCYLDVHEKYHGPHGLVAGTTGSGKSETLQTYMLSLALNFSPDDIGFFIIDYKGGGMANLFDGLPHIIGAISNLSGNQIRRAMVSIKSENKRRQRIFNEYGVNNINLYTRLYKNNESNIPVPHLFIIIDEFAELKREQPEFMKELISVAQVGRSLGVHLILATQKPSGTVDDNIWSNSKFRLCLRVQDRQDSMDMLHKPDAAYITQAGRCYMQVGNDELYELFQSAWSGAVYDESGTVQSDIAKIVGSNGRTAISGSYSQVKQKEKKKIEWIKTLIDCMDSSLSAAGIVDVSICCGSMSTMAHVVELFYAEMEKRGIEYPVSEFNSRRIEDFIAVYSAVISAEERGEDFPQRVSIKAEELRKKLPESKEKTQLDAVVDYLARTADKNGFHYDLRLWLPVLPEELYLDELLGYTEKAYNGTEWPEPSDHFSLDVMVGLYDDPENQAQNPLTVDVANEGNLAVIGAAMSGKSTFLSTYLYSLFFRYSPDVVNAYILDYSAKKLGAFAGMPHVGGIMFEDDDEKVSKFFTFIENVQQERKKIFEGGNYSQYVRSNGYVLPAILIVIDNFSSFRTKTETKYDERMINLLKEANSCGIYIVVTAGGFSSAEIPGRMGELFRNTLSLSLNDKYQYSEVVRTTRVEVTPEENVQGRGIFKLGEAVLEYQTALPIRAADDFERSEKIKSISADIASKWTGKAAREIPTIPEEPVWSEFSALPEFKSMVSEGIRIPVGYDKKTATVYGINLESVYTYIVSGKSRTGKTNFLRIIMLAASMMNTTVTVIDTAGELKALADDISAEYVGDGKALYDFCSKLLPDFKERNAYKKECLSRGLTDSEIFREMQRFTKRIIIIGNLPDFVNLVRKPGEGIDDLSGFMCNLFEKGAIHNVFWFAQLNQDNAADIAGMNTYASFIKEKNGIHFGGNVAGQRLLTFDHIPYANQNKKLPAGIGMLPTNDDETVETVVVPFYRKEDSDDKSGDNR